MEIKRFTRILYILRDNNNYTMAEMARKLEISIAQYRRYEHGESKPKPEIIKKVEEAFSISLEETSQKADDGIAQMMEMINDLKQKFDEQNKLIHQILDRMK